MELLEEIELLRDQLENLQRGTERIVRKMNKEISIRKIQSFVRNQSIQRSRENLQQDLDNLTSIFQKSIEKSNRLEAEVEQVGRELEKARSKLREAEDESARLRAEAERQKSIFKIQSFMRGKRQHASLQKTIKILNENLEGLQVRAGEQE